MSNLVTQLASWQDNLLNRKIGKLGTQQAVLLKAEKLHKIYKKAGQDIHAVRDVSLEIKKGEILVIIGPSGAGKSTLLHLLGGLDEPTTGSVHLDGIDLYKIRDNKRAWIRNKKIGFVFQFYHLLPEFTVVENTILPAIMRQKKREDKKEILNKAKDVLEKVGLADRLTHKPNELSGGEAQRVAIARALINEPAIVFCDEPTGNLDSTTSNEICSLIHKLNDQKHVSFVIVTHEPSLTKKADKVLHIKDGKLA